MNKPNIFKYATKELSQDAFIFWLLDHVNPKYKDVDPLLKNCALKLIAEFFELENKIFTQEIFEFKLIKQHKNIDILLGVNGFSIIIEDKTGTKAHGDQLTRYKNIIASEVGEENVIAIYFKTHDQSNYRKEIADGFKIFSRDKLISLLRQFDDVTSDIFNNFKDYIIEIENEVNAFTDKDEWNNKNWIGFFKLLQSELKRGDWSYVSNPNGGFMGYWWAFQKNELCTQYLQLQQDDLVLKINSNAKENDKKFRDICYKHFLVRAKQQGINFEKPSRFGKGETMTVLTTKYLVRNSDTGLVNIEKTLETLTLYTQFIELNSLKGEFFV